jgi:transposase
VSLDSKISQASPVRLVNQIIARLDISKVIETCKGGGTNAYSPRVMLKIVIFAYLSNIYSCRKIEDAVRDRFSMERVWCRRRTALQRTIENNDGKILHSLRPLYSSDS